MTTHDHRTTGRRGLLLDVAGDGRTATVRLFGVLDARTARRLRAVARIGSVDGARLVTLDIGRLTVADVAGWQALRDLTAELAGRGTTVVHAGGRGREGRLDALLARLAPTAA